MVDKISQAPSNYTTPQLPEVGVSAPIDQGTDWASIIKTVGSAYGGVKTEQFMAEQEATAKALREEHAIDPKIQNVSTIRSIMEKQAAGAITEEDTKMLAQVMKGYENLQAAFEQGRQKQKDFELRAQALLRQSIARRPDLTTELNKLYSNAVGTPSLEMLQHKYFAEDLNWVGDAAKAKKGPSEADVSRRIGDLLQLANNFDATDKQVVLGVASQAQAALLNPEKGVAEAERLLADPGLQGVLTRGVGDSMQQFLEVTQATAGFDSKISGLRDVAARVMPDSPEWQTIVTNMRGFESAIRAENIALANLNIPAAKTKIEQNNRDLELLASLQAKADDPVKVNGMLTGHALLRARNIPADATNIISSYLADFSKEAIDPIAQSFASGSEARKLGGHRQGLYKPSSPESFNLFTRQLSINPKGDKMTDTEKAGAMLTLSGLLADWGYPILDADKRVVARSMEDYFDPRQGVLASLATAIPALDNTYMTKETLQQSPAAFMSNLFFIGGIIDQANLSVYKRLSYEGLDRFVKRGSVMELAREGRAINWDSALQIVGNPDEQQRKRLNEILGTAKTRTAPITGAYDRYIKLRTGGK